MFEVVAMPKPKIVWEIRPSKHGSTFDLISNELPFERTCGYHYVAGAVRHAKAYSGDHAAVIRVYDEAGNVVETHEAPLAISKRDEARNARSPFRAS